MKELSKERSGRENFRQFPVNLSSSIVWMFCTENFTEGPSGDFMTQRKKSVFFLASR